MTTVEIDGIRVQTRGATGSPVLFLHGIGGAAASFRGQLDALGETQRALAWDAPGYGESADPASAPGMEGYADLAASVLGGEPTHVVGVSWGGVIATRLAARHPALVRSLVLADSTRGSGRTPEGAAAMRARAGELASAGAAEFARIRGPRLVSPFAAPSVVDGVVTTMARVRLPGYRFAAESMADTDHGALLPRLAVPTLVLVGAEDRVTGVAESRRIANAVPGARLEILPHAGHAANQERPEEFNRIVSEFFAAVETAPVPAHHGAAV